jgi:hypothetical protein
MLHDAVQWIRANTVPGQGIVRTSRARSASVGASGAAVAPLRALGESKLAAQYARWLVDVQHPAGCLGGGALTDGPSAFDTGWAVRGWVGMLDLMPEVEGPLRRACEWLVASAAASAGALPAPAAGLGWDLGGRGVISEGVHLATMAAVRRAGQLLGEPEWVACAERSRDHYLRALPLSEFARRNARSDAFALIQLALIELDCRALAHRGMAAVAPYQQISGAVPAYADVTWVCTAGLAQCAWAWLRLGYVRRAQPALEFLERLQNGNGGFLGSYGLGADDGAAVEDAWAVVAALEAVLASRRGTLETHASQVSPVSHGLVQRGAVGAGRAA